jgi:hypothetical protein
VVLTLAVSGYMAGTTVLSLHEVNQARRCLLTAKTESAELSRQAANERKAEAQRGSPEPRGIDAFAVSFSNWAQPRGVRVDSFTPEGAPAPTEVSFQGVKLGVWNANKIRVKGQGDYWQLVCLLREFETTRVPVRLESFELQSSQRAGGADVAFDLLLTVYEKVDPGSGGAGAATVGTGEAGAAGAAG